MHWVLLHSPLTGPAVWQGVALEARERGITVDVPRLPDLFAVAPPYYAELGAVVARQVTSDLGITLVVHSSAGSLVPMVGATLGWQLANVIYADAILPHPGRSWFSTVGTELAETLRGGLANEAVPAWSDWFVEGALAGLIDDPDLAAEFQAELSPTPRAFLDQIAPDLELKPHTGWSYLRLSDIYEREAQYARKQGRPTLRLDLHHLAAMTHVSAVTSALINLDRGRP